MLSAREEVGGGSGGRRATLPKDDFEFLKKFIHDTFGIFLADHKRDMLASRLRKALERRGLPDYRSYIDTCLKSPSGDVLEELANCVSTNHTFFNREAAHYKFLSEKALPELAAAALKRNRGRKELRAWCAAASQGHEPYTLAMLLAEHFKADYKSWDAGVLGTDISDAALSIARTGLYPDDEVSQMPDVLRSQYMKKQLDGSWLVADSVRQDVLYRRFNLLNSLPFKKPFDFIFCRNVMIYFDDETRGALVQRMVNALYPGGYLFIGMSESLPRNITGIKTVQSAVFQKIGA